MMTQNIYEIFQEIIPELKQQDLPDDLDDYYTFSEWMNESIQIWHYIEMKEFYNHDIEDNHFLIEKNVDCHVIDQKISQAVDQLIEQNKGNKYIDLLDETYEIFFNTLQETAEQQQLSLLVIFRENPYWLVVPTQDELQLQRIVDVFNQSFKNDDLTMGMY